MPFTISKEAMEELMKAMAILMEKLSMPTIIENDINEDVEHEVVESQPLPKQVTN